MPAREEIYAKNPDEASGFIGILMLEKVKVR